MDERFPTRRHIADCPLLQSFDIIVLAIWFASSLLHAEALRIHGHCPARALAGGVAVPAAPSLRAIALRRISPLLWPRPTPRFAFAIARPPKFLTELSRRVVLLCPARALAVGFAVASGDLPSGLRPSAHAPARPKPIRALGVGFTASELLAASPLSRPARPFGLSPRFARPSLRSAGMS